VEADNIEVTFGPAAGDRGTLSKASLATLGALYRHPISHNLEWSDVIALLGKLGSVEQKSHNETAFRIGGEHHLVRKPHTKDLSASDVMDFRHLLTRSGWAPHTSSAASSSAPTATTGMAEVPDDILVVVEHHEARLYHLDVRSTDPADDVIRPYDPHHFLHHLSHKDQAGERGQRAPEDPSYYKRIAEAIAPCSRIVVIGHGKGHSNAAHHLIEYLKLHHPQTYKKLAHQVVTDLSSVTVPQLLVHARRALSS